MKNIKVPILILLTILLLIACASLPAIAAAVQDKASVNNSGYSDMQSVELNLGEEKETLPMMGKLAMLGNMEVVNIDLSQASMTEEEVFTAVEAQMAAYEEAGIFQWFDVTLRSAVPKLGVDLDDANNFLVHWTVSFVNEDNPISLVLDIDDETGKILSLTYGVYDSFTMDGVWKRNKVIMDDFTDVYFTQLGLTEAAEYAESTGTGYEYSERDGGVSSALYSFGDVTYGEITMEFYVEGPGGFYLYFPN